MFLVYARMTSQVLKSIRQIKSWRLYFFNFFLSYDVVEQGHFLWQLFVLIVTIFYNSQIVTYFTDKPDLLRSLLMTQIILNHFPKYKVT